MNMAKADRAVPSGAEFWRRHARRYDRATLLLNRKLPDVAAMAAEDLRGCRRVLEVGAGTGLVTEKVAGVVEELVATDRSREMLAILSSRVESLGLTNVRVQEADALKLPFPDDAFDAAVAANVLHLLPQPDAAIRELIRVVREGGVISTPTFVHGETLLAGTVSRLLSMAGFPVQTRFRGAELVRLVEGDDRSVVRHALVPGILPLQYVAVRVSKAALASGAKPEAR